MPKAALTKRFIDDIELAPAGKTEFYWDTDLAGFALKVTPKKKIFFAQARVGGKNRRVTLGAYGALTPKQARDMAKMELAKIAQGEDPSVERQKHKAQAVTLGQVAASYIKTKILKPNSIKDINKHMNAGFSEWADRPLAQVNRAATKNKFLEMGERSHAQANQAFRIFRALWNYAVAEYRYPDDSPVFGENPVNIISEQNLWNTVQPRNTKIPLDKAGLAWNTLQGLNRAMAQSPASRTMVDATMYIFLSGARVDEATGLTWDRVNTEEKWWHLDDPKNHHKVTFPLSDLACQIVNSRPRVNEYVFASNGKYGHIKDVRTPMKKISEAIKVNVTAHDLRRTFKAIAVENGIEKWKFDLLTNHKLADISSKHYLDTDDLLYLRDEINTIAAWIVEQARIANTNNVITMAGRNAKVI
ncbi:integrase family protein [uncultured Desulfobacter sp.]|uniref:tyrosine-type recombinase/integrase n=1 Tax=uncultured Desulfobacter sp. TaxID=240139 RepID=UPI002AA8962D|nr:integrase family protein [uncultured Desulfobacter sp.]